MRVWAKSNTEATCPLLPSLKKLVKISHSLFSSLKVTILFNENIFIGFLVFMNKVPQGGRLRTTNLLSRYSGA